jgi:hypothetical protein
MERRRPNTISAQAMDSDVGRKQLVYHAGLPSIPDLLEPVSRELAIVGDGLGHGSSRWLRWMHLHIDFGGPYIDARLW